MDSMKKKIPHIFKSGLAYLLAVSMLCHIIVPFSVQANKAAFSFWLSNNITIQSESEIHLRDSILQLSDRSPSLYALVEEASELVRNHQDKFHLNLPLPAEESSSRTVTFLLLDQWSAVNTQRGVQDAILPDITQNFQKWIHPPLVSILFNKEFLRDGVLELFTEYFINPARHLFYLLIPLSGGISINAP